MYVLTKAEFPELGLSTVPVMGPNKTVPVR